MDVWYLIQGLGLTVIGGIVGYYINWMISRRNIKDVTKLFDEKFGPQVINMLVGETGGEFKKHAKSHSEEKELIGRYVANRWAIENTTFLLDAGTTTERVARHLAVRVVEDMIVCTANPVAALHFMSRGRQKCYLLPGEIDASYAGTISNKKLIESVIQLAYMNNNKNRDGTVAHRNIAVIGALPMLPKTGPCSNDERTIHIKRTLIDLSDEIIFVVDYSKFHDEGKYGNKYYPVFANKGDWEYYLNDNRAKPITIVTCLRDNNPEKINRLDLLNNQYKSKIHCEIL